MQGFFALYRGLSPILLMSFPKSGVRFGAFSIYSRWFRDDQGRMSAPKNFACGLMAGATEAVLVVTPQVLYWCQSCGGSCQVAYCTPNTHTQETLKVRLMNLNMGFVPGVKHIVAKEGIAGLYQGLPATIGKQATNQVPWALSLSFCLHTTLSLSLTQHKCLCLCCTGHSFCDLQ